MNGEIYTAVYSLYDCVSSDMISRGRPAAILLRQPPAMTSEQATVGFISRYFISVNAIY